MRHVHSRHAPENGADLKHAWHVGDDGHLFVELGALRQTPWPAHVVQPEDLRHSAQ